VNRLSEDFKVDGMLLSGCHSNFEFCLMHKDGAWVDEVIME